ncbi:MAG: hypothetical protein E4H01_00650 [Lysobacterales bacterium]|nr:MAG: hypothetical protein E4H01_00650 [Xanthomonadales bacterium]
MGEFFTWLEESLLEVGNNISAAFDSFDFSFLSETIEGVGKSLYDPVAEFGSFGGVADVVTDAAAETDAGGISGLLTGMVGGAAEGQADKALAWMGGSDPSDWAGQLDTGNALDNVDMAALMKQVEGASESTLGKLWDSLDGKTKTNVMLGGLKMLTSGVAGYAGAKLNEGKDQRTADALKDVNRDKLAAQDEMDQKNRVGAYSGVPGSTPFKPRTPGTTPQIDRPSGGTAYQPGGIVNRARA